MSGIFNMGGLIGAFAGPKLQQIKYNTGAFDQLNALNGAVGDARAANNQNVADYSAATKLAINKLLGLESGDTAELNSATKTLSGNDPLATRGAIADQNFNAFDKYVNRVGAETTLNDKLRSARLGYGESPGSTYGTTLITDRTSRNLSPALSQLLGNLGGDSSRVEADRRGNYGALLGLQAARAGIPLRAAELNLAPIQARNGVNSDAIGQLMAIINASKADTAGFKEKQNKWAAAAGALDSSANSAVDTGMSLASMYFGGGMAGGAAGALGGMGGGGGGRGGGGGGYQPQATPQWYNPPAEGYNTFPMRPPPQGMPVGTNLSGYPANYGYGYNPNDPSYGSYLTDRSGG